MLEKMEDKLYDYKKSLVLSNWCYQLDFDYSINPDSFFIWLNSFCPGYELALWFEKLYWNCVVLWSIWLRNLSAKMIAIPNWLDSLSLKEKFIPKIFSFWSDLLEDDVYIWLESWFKNIKEAQDFILNNYWNDQMNLDNIDWLLWKIVANWAINRAKIDFKNIIIKKLI